VSLMSSGYFPPWISRVSPSKKHLAKMRIAGKVPQRPERIERIEMSITIDDEYRFSFDVSVYPDGLIIFSNYVFDISYLLGFVDTYTYWEFGSNKHNSYQTDYVRLVGRSGGQSKNRRSLQSEF